jgi:MoxR-like ATPase
MSKEAQKAEIAKTELNIEEMARVLEHTIQNNKILQDAGKVPVAVNIEGGAGIGKTSTVKQLAARLGMGWTKLSLSQLDELGDLIGFPLKEFEMVKINDKQERLVRWVPESMMQTYIQSGYKPSGEKRMSHAVPEWIQGKGENHLLILDDYSRAQARFIQATMEIIDQQEYISWKLPKGWTVLLTSNPDNGDYFVTALDVAQKTRMININLKFDVQIWAKWAEQNEIDSRGINFLLKHPELINEQAGINARSVTTFFNSITSIQDFDKDLPLISLLGEGSVGPEFTQIFCTFIANRLDKLMHPKDILLEPDFKKVVAKLQDVIGENDKARADIASVIATRVINYTIHYASKETVTQKIKERIIEICTYEKLFTADLRYAIIKAIVNADKQQFQSLMMNEGIIQMSIR